MTGAFVSNAVYREHFAGKRLRLTDAQRRRLAVKGKTVGLRVLARIATIGAPDTILRGYRQLVAQKHDGSRKRGPGRPRTRDAVAALIVRMANDRDPLFSAGFRAILGSGVTTIKLPVKSPNLNAYAERFVLSIKSECLKSRGAALGARHLRQLVTEFVAHRRGLPTTTAG